MTTSLIADTSPLGQLIQIFAYGVIDLINCANFVENRFGGSGAGRRWKMTISHWNSWSPLQQRCATAQTVMGAE